MTTTEEFSAQPAKARRSRVLGRFARNSDGATAIEFALLAIPFLLTLFAILETGLSMTTQQLLVNATDRVARDIRTGNIPSLTEAQLKTRICERISWMVASGCPGLQVDLRTYTSFKQAADQQVNLVGDKIVLDYDKKGKPMALKTQLGGSGQRQTLRAFYLRPLTTKLLQGPMGSTGDGRVLLSASQTWQNEQF